MSTYKTLTFSEAICPMTQQTTYSELLFESQVTKANAIMPKDLAGSKVNNV